MPYQEAKPAIDTAMRQMCLKPYPNHDKGCPNFGKKRQCPPQCFLLEEILELRAVVFAIWNIFDFGEHVTRMRKKHPMWSKRQIECCLYWQGTARKHLEDEIRLFREVHPSYHILRCPEATGVNITRTMSTIDHQLEWPPVNVTYQVALAGKFKI